MKQHFLVILVLSLIQTAVWASVIGIDYGTDWFKAALVKPGVPLDVVLNRESKRKTASVVTIRNGIRHFGSDAVALSTKVPKQTFLSLKNLVAKTFDQPLVEEFKSLYANELVEDADRHTVAFKIDDETTFTLEELLAMQLSHAKRQAVKHGGEAVSGAVITVPPYYNQFERRAILDAAELANLRVLQLVNDETAVALNYAMARLFNETQYHIFYDMGAGSTVATLVKFYDQVIPGTKYNKTVPSIEVKATGFDSTLGGKSVDAKLADHLASLFHTQYKTKLSSDPKLNARAMAKFMKEANRVKQILSANTETFASIENVMEELDFKAKVTRADLETLCSDLMDRLQKPIKDVLSKTGLKVQNIDSLVLVGGGVRVPFVQSSLKVLVGEEKIAKNVNGDEAAVLGAAFLAAGISKQFRVREIQVQDMNFWPVQVTYQSDKNEGKEIHTTLFTEQTELGARKYMNLKKSADFEFTLSYADSSVSFLKAKITGLTDAFAQFEGKFVKTPVVRVLIVLTPSGTFEVGEAQVTFDLDESKTGGSIKDAVLSFFGGKKEEGEATVDDVPGRNETEVNEAAVNGTALNETKIEKPKVTTESVALNVTVEYLGVQPMSQEAKDAAKKTLKKMDEEDRARTQREEARNHLESFLYSSREFMYEDVAEVVSTEEERDAFKEQLSETSDWLDMEAESAAKDVFVEKLSALKKPFEVFVKRKEELEQRPERIEQFKEGLTKLETFIIDYRANVTKIHEQIEVRKQAASQEESAEKAENSTETAEPVEEEADPAIFTEEELNAVESKMKEAREWLDAKVTEQNELTAAQDPVLTVKALEEKQTEIFGEFFKLTMKLQSEQKKRMKSKKKKAAKTTSTSESATVTETSSESATEPVVEKEAESSSNDHLDDEL